MNSSTSRPLVALGPELDRPTWSWVGFNLFRELSKYYKVKVYSWDEQPVADVILTFKEPLPFPVQGSTPIIYFPCDYYKSYPQAVEDTFLRSARVVVCHSESLASVLRNLHSNVHIIDHDSKYVLPEIADYKETGPIAWIGYSVYLEHLKKWLHEHPIDGQLVVLTDAPNLVSLSGNTIQSTWSPKRQQVLMKFARGALDVKGSDFGQSTKPAEKLQTFVASGVPSACNQTATTIVQEFRRDGFEIVDPTDTNLWFSRDYYEQTRRYAETLRSRMSLQSIGLRVKEIVDSVL